MPHVELNNVSEWGNWYRAARTVLTRRPADGCGMDNPSGEMIEEKSEELQQANQQHLSNDEWVMDSSAETPVDADHRAFAAYECFFCPDDVQIYVPDDFCPAEQPVPQPVQAQPESSPVPPPPADADAQPDAGADDGDAGTTPPPDAGTTVTPTDTQTGDGGVAEEDAGVDADGDTVNDADQAEDVRRRDAARPPRETGGAPRDAGRRDAGSVFIP